MIGELKTEFEAKNVAFEWNDGCSFEFVMFMLWMFYGFLEFWRCCSSKFYCFMEIYNNFILIFV